MAKLHEILAVESTTEKAYQQGVEQVNNQLKNKEKLYGGRIRTLQMFNKNETNKVEMEAIEAKDKIVEPLSATIPGTLNYLAVLTAEHFNVLFQKEATNQNATADIILPGGTVVAKEVPVTFLLGMETRLLELRNRVLVEIPTLDPAHVWTQDIQSGPNIFKSEEINDMKTSKEITYPIKAPATQHHPAQVDTVSKELNIGAYKSFLFSGKISSAKKAELILNIDRLLKAVKQARQRANSEDLVEHNDIGGALMKAIIGDFYNPEVALTQK